MTKGRDKGKNYVRTEDFGLGKRLRSLQERPFLVFAKITGVSEFEGWRAIA